MALLDTIVAQNTAGHADYKSHPHGMPSNWNQYNGFWKYNPSNPGCSSGTAWGQVYPRSGSARVPKGRFETRNHVMLVHRKIGGWSKVQDVAAASFNTEGGIFGAQFEGNRARDASLVQATDPIGGASMALPLPGECTHWWAAPRASFQANAIDWCYHQEDIRLTNAADVGGFIANIGVDWWRTLSAPYPENPLAGMANWVDLRTDWITLGFYSCSDAQFRSDLPEHLRGVVVSPPPPPPAEPEPPVDLAERIEALESHVQLLIARADDADEGSYNLNVRVAALEALAQKVKDIG